MFTLQDKAKQDADFIVTILKNAHFYKTAPEESEQKIAYELGEENRDKILVLIEKIHESQKNNPCSLKFFEYFIHLMEYGDNMETYSPGTCEKMAYEMNNDLRTRVLQIIKKIRDFNPYHII